MSFPSNLVTQKTTDMDDAQEPLGVGGVLMVIGAFIVSATFVGLFFGWSAYIGLRTFKALNTCFPGP